MTELPTATIEMFDEPVEDETRKAFEEIIAGEFDEVPNDGLAQLDALEPKTASERVPFGMGLLVVEDAKVDAAKHVASTDPVPTWTPRDDGSGHDKIDSVKYNDAD